MDNIKDVITQISNDFILEAKSSPALMADMAAMEKYMAESYTSRIFIELIQNADDCGSNKVGLYEKDGTLYFANDGRAFDANDIRAICRSGASMKRRGENIGYRGVGFKSTTALSEDILIYSSNTLFTFSKKVASKQLGVDKNSVPTVRIPFLLNISDAGILQTINSFLKEGYNTIFVFKNANVERLKEEIHELSSDVFIFLRFIEHCFINTTFCQKYISMEREHSNSYSYIQTGNERWKIIRDANAALAFKMEGDRMIPCQNNEAVFHCFLPTLDKSPYPFKINADFSTDPSRKHITYDDITDKAIDTIGMIIANLVSDCLNGSNIIDKSFLTLLKNNGNFSVVNQKLTAQLKRKITSIQLVMTDNRRQKISDYKLLPEWLEPGEKEMLRLNSMVIHYSSLPHFIYEKNYHVDEFMTIYSQDSYDNETLIKILEESVVQNLMLESHIRFATKVIKKAILDDKIYGKKSDLSKVIDNLQRRDDQGISAVELLGQGLNDLEKDYISESTGLTFRRDKKTEESKKAYKEQRRVERIRRAEGETNNEGQKIIGPAYTTSSRPAVAKWRSAEQRVVIIEKSMGNDAKDVSRMNVGYDIESVDKNGRKRYIEVKSLNKDTSEFSITNNEYTTAHQYGKDYYICLLFENKAIYIQDPLKALEFVKRIRQWEWVCDRYEGIEIPFDVY